MSRLSFLLLLAGSLAVTALGGCSATMPHALGEAGAPSAVTTPIRGHASFEPGRQVASTMTEIASGSVVSLIDPINGDTVTSSLTDGSGNFVLTFPATFTPAASATYTLEAIKGLSVGGAPNRAGASAARIRSFLLWNQTLDGWESLTNTAVNTGIAVNPATTAIAIIADLLRAQGDSLVLSSLAGTVSGNTFADTGTGISATNDFAPVLADVNSAIALDQDPVAVIGYDQQDGTYTLATDVPLISSLSPSIPTPGGTVTLQGANFDPSPGRNALYFGTDPAGTWSVSADRTSTTVSVPTSAYSAPFVLQEPGGVIETLSGFLDLHGTVGTLAGDGTAGSVDGQGPTAEIAGPWALVRDLDGNLYAGGWGNPVIRIITPSGVVTTLAGSATQGYADGTGGSAQFESIRGLALDGSGNLYVADGGCTIRRVEIATGRVSTVAGLGGSCGDVDGVGSLARFNTPSGIAVDSSGDLYVSDYWNNLIRKVTPSGVVTTLAGGSAGFADGTGSLAGFSKPMQIAIDGGGNLYVADYIDCRIRKVTPAGVVTTVAGNGTVAELDGTGTSAELTYPFGVALDGSGDLFVTDGGADTIRKIVLSSSAVTTVAGTANIAAFADGAALSSRFDTPAHLASDPQGNLYVADYVDNRIRVVTP